MCDFIKYILSLFLIFAFWSCAESLEDISAETESVNGFELTWRRNVSEQKREVIRDILNDMQYVQGGLFLMGATLEQEPYARQNESPAHYVSLSDYYIGKNEISIEQIEILLECEFSNYEREHERIDNFTWDSWAALIGIINDYTGLKFDFPTEAQWEYAARGGCHSKGTVFPGGNTVSEAAGADNELGLSDMFGRHSEWCKDAYVEYEAIPLQVNPCYSSGLGHVVRGGNEHSLENDKNYLTDDNYRFSSYYDDFRMSRVSARSYYGAIDVDWDEDQIWAKYISCRLVINNNDKYDE